LKTVKMTGFLLIAAILIFGCMGNNGNSNNNDTVSGGTTITSNSLGTYDGYDYEFWSNGIASGSMTVGAKGTFQCEWTSNGSGSNILFRSGKRFGASQTHNQIGDITISYGANYNPAGTSYLSVYGWTRSPLAEYYIVESYFGTGHPGRWNNPVYYGTFTIPEEGTYEIYKTQMNNAPSIDGNGKNFPQYISVRTEKRSSGTISVSRHFEEWQRIGLDMSGRLYEAMMKVEGYQSSGNANLTQNIITITR